MWLKILIIINFLLLIISLFSGLIFVYQEKGQGNKTFYALCIRVALALTLMALLAYGLATGMIAHYAPWEH